MLYQKYFVHKDFQIRVFKGSNLIFANRNLQLNIDKAK